MTSRFHPIAFAVLMLLTLSACSQQKTASSVFEQAKEECVADVIPKQFIVQYVNGESAIVRAESEQAFIAGYVTDNLAQIEFAEPDYKVHSQPLTNSGAVRAASGAVNNWGVMRVAADSFWQQGIRGANVLVAVVDSGVDVQHPQLASRIALNSAEIPNNSIDDDHNGFVDDYYGWNFVAGAPLTADNQYHGTHVAGIIAASHSDTVAGAQSYVQGTAPEAKILPLAFLNGDGEGSMSNGVRAINYAVQRGARVINASWGGAYCSRSLRDAIAGLDAKNVLFVAAAGNEHLNIDRDHVYPASLNFPALFTVGATGPNDIMGDYSNYGAKAVHIFAPGTQIISTFPGNSMATLTGTSMATPFVSGAMALLASIAPGATNNQLRQALYSSAYKQGTYWNASLGRIDMRQARAELVRVMNE